MAQYALPINKSISEKPRDQLKQAAERLFAERGFTV